MATADVPARSERREFDGPKRSLVAGILLGIGIAGFVDETVFHQILHWHHFYDGSTPVVGLVSDGIFHAVMWTSAVSALFLYGDLHRRDRLDSWRWRAGVLFGLGGFQFEDGIINHKLLGLHQIRYHVTIWPYDVVWNLIAVAVLVAGVMIFRRARRESPVAAVAKRL